MGKGSKRPFSTSTDRHDNTVRYRARATIMGYGVFSAHGDKWTSHFASAVFQLSLRLTKGTAFDLAKHSDDMTAEIVFTFGQQSRKSSDSSHRKPFFPPKEKERMTTTAKRLFGRFISEYQAGSSLSTITSKKCNFVLATNRQRAANAKHDQERCQRCCKAPVPCTAVIEVLEGQFMSVKSRYEFNMRYKLLQRLKKECCLGTKVPANCMRLYHQTSAAAAERILSEEEMRRGGQGLFGGGIYFAASPKAANNKAQEKGVILECTVYLGKCKRVTEPHSTLAFAELVKEGFDSVHGVRTDSFLSTGDEYVVYNRDQVLHIRRYVKAKK